MTVPAAEPTDRYAVSPEIKVQIAAELRRVWVHTRYQTKVELTIQHRLREQLKRDTSAQERQLLDRLRDVDVAIEVIDEEIRTLQERP